MKAIILLAVAVAAEKVGNKCAKSADCDVDAKEVCMTAKVAMLETKTCNTKNACETAKAGAITGTTISCGASYLAAAVTIMSLCSQL